MTKFKKGLFFISYIFFTITCFSVSARPCDDGISVYYCDYYFILKAVTCEWKSEPAKEITCTLPDFNLYPSGLRIEGISG